MVPILIVSHKEHNGFPSVLPASYLTSFVVCLGYFRIMTTTSDRNVVRGERFISACGFRRFESIVGARCGRTAYFTQWQTCVTEAACVMTDKATERTKQEPRSVL